MILNWLRYKKLMVPKYMELKDVLVVAEYFGIQMVEEVEIEASSRRSAKLPEGWVCLNVGGTLFETRRSTLAKASGLITAIREQQDGTYTVDAPNDSKVSPSNMSLD